MTLTAEGQVAVQRLGQAFTNRERAWQRYLQSKGDSDLSAYLAASSKVTQAVFAAADAVGVGGTVNSGEGTTMTVVQRYMDNGLPVYVLTSDGGAFLPEWHRPEVDGPFASAKDAFYERYGVQGRLGHGYVHHQSRKITQTG